MFGSLGPLEILIIGAFYFCAFALPYIVLWRAATRRGQTHAYTFWGLLGWLGVLFGFLIMGRQPQRAFAQRTAVEHSEGRESSELADDPPLPPKIPWPYERGTETWEPDPKSPSYREYQKLKARALKARQSSEELHVPEGPLEAEYLALMSKHIRRNKEQAELRQREQEAALAVPADPQTDKGSELTKRPNRVTGPLRRLTLMFAVLVAGIPVFSWFLADVPIRAPHNGLQLLVSGSLLAGLFWWAKRDRELLVSSFLLLSVFAWVEG